MAIREGGTIYALKRRYGQRVVVFKHGSTTVDPKLGTRTPVFTGYDVRRAVIMPTSHSRLAKAKAFNYDVGETSVLIDARDVAALSDLTTEDFIYQQVGGKKLQVVTWEIEDGAWTVTARELRGDTVDLTVGVDADDSLGLAQAAEDE